jgi:hypothetical protein
MMGFLLPILYNFFILIGGPADVPDLGVIQSIKKDTVMYQAGIGL